jgi:HAD superfamily hydrolase (TIGR01509 family)
MEDIFHLDRFVDDIIISAEEGIIKPDRRIYQIALDRLGAEPDTTLFVDDYPANVKGARDLGMKAVHFIDNKQAMQHIQTYLDNEKA